MACVRARGGGETAHRRCPWRRFGGLRRRRRRRRAGGSEAAGRAVVEVVVAAAAAVAVALVVEWAGADGTASEPKWS